MLAAFASGADNNAFYAYVFIKSGLNETVRLTSFWQLLGNALQSGGESLLF